MRGLGRLLAIALIALTVATETEALEEVQFNAPGASDALDRRLRNASLLLGNEVQQADDVQEILAAARAEYARLLGVLYAEGHFGGVINVLVDGREAAGLSPLNPPRVIDRISVTVQPGPLYRFSRAEVAPLASNTELPEGYRVGEPARVPAIRGAVDAAVVGWRDAGHAKADVAEEDIVARHPQQSVDASVRIAPGPSVTFGRFTVTGNRGVRESAIRRIAGFPEGKRFSPEQLQRSARRLRRTNAFRSVALSEAQELQPGAVLPVTATVVEMPPRRFGFGAEYDTSDGATISGFWLHRNILGGAERLRFDAEISGIGGDNGGTDYSFGVSFTRPATFNPDTDFVTALTLSHEDEEDYISDALNIGAGFQRNIRDRFTAEYGIGFFYSRDEVDGEVTEYSLLTFPLGASTDRRDDPLNPTSGYYAEVDVTPFAGLNEASGTGARMTFDGRGYYGFGDEDRVVAAGRLQAKSIVGAELTETPNDYRFYSGGGGTVRGFPYESLGVTLPDGQASGGASFFGVSAEARVGVTESIQGVAFVDYGYVGENSFPDDTGGDQVGAGLGLRYVTPIGPIRLDVAVPVSGEADSDFQIYVGIGQAF